MSQPDFRALCAELADDLEEWVDGYLINDPPDEHTAASFERINRARAALSQPAPEPPTDEELTQLLFDNHRTAIEFVCESEPEGDLIIQNHLRFARAVLARWGQGNG